VLAELMPDWISQEAVRRVSTWPLASDEHALLLVTCLRGLMKLEMPKHDPLVLTVLRAWHPYCPQEGEWFEWCREPCPVNCVADGKYEDCPISCQALHETMNGAGLAQALADDWLHRNAFDWAELRWVVEDLPMGDPRHVRLRELLPALGDHELRAMQDLQVEARECAECLYWQPGWLFVDDERTCDDCLYDEDFSLRDCVSGASELLMPEVPASRLCEVIEIVHDLASRTATTVKTPAGPLEVLGHALATWPVATHTSRRDTLRPKWWRKTGWVRQVIGGLLCFDCRAPVGIAHLSDCVMALCSHCHLPPWTCPGCEAPLTRSRGETARYFTHGARLN